MFPAEATVHVILLVLSSVVTLALGGFGWRHREVPGASGFVGLMVAVSLWAGVYAVALTVHDPGLRVLMEYPQWLGIAAIPVCWLAFTTAYTGSEEFAPRPVVAGLVGLAVLTNVLVWTNPLHHLVWTDHTVVVTDGIVTVSQSFGPWYWVNAGISYTVILFGTLLLVRLVLTADLYRDQSVLLVVGALVPSIANLVAVLGETSIPGLDLTPYGFTVTGLLFAAALYGSRLFDLVPATHRLGRDAVIETLDDAVVVIDDRQSVLYCNPAAFALFEADESVLGRHASALHDLDAIDYGSSDALGELRRDGRTYEIRVSPIAGRQGGLLGYTLTFHDVTERTEREATLRWQRDELATVNAINTAIRGINVTLVGATTHEDLERDVPLRLTESEMYDDAWLGLDPSYARLVTTRPDGPPVAADGGVILQGSMADLPGPVSLDAPATATWMAVPVASGPLVHGALVVATDRSDAFGERERDILGEFGATVGHAVTAIDHRRLLLADVVVELELACGDDRSPLARLSKHADVAWELDGIVPGADRSLLVYLTVAPEATATLLDAAEAVGLEATRTTGDGVVITLSGPSVLRPLVDAGADVTVVRGSGDGLELTVALLPSADVRTLLDAVVTAFPETTLVAKRERERTDRAAATPEDLTDRQHQSLELAFRKGYYDWPRGATAEEVAAELGVSSPTLHNHLRKAERKLVAGFFDASKRGP